MVQVASEGCGGEFVNEFVTRFYLSRAWNTVHAGCVNAVKMKAVGMAARVEKSNADKVALSRAQGWPRNTPVINPGGERDAGRDFDVHISGDNLVFAQRSPVGKHRNLARIPIGQNGMGVETVAFVIDGSNNGICPRMPPGNLVRHAMIMRSRAGLLKKSRTGPQKGRRAKKSSP